MVLKICKIIGQSMKIINRKEHLAIVVTHDNLPNVVLCAVKRWFKAIKQGPPDLFSMLHTMAMMLKAMRLAWAEEKRRKWK